MHASRETRAEIAVSLALACLSVVAIGAAWLAPSGSALAGLAAVAVAAAGASAGGWLLRRRVVDPLRALEQALSALLEGGAGVRVRPRGVRAARELAETFNEVSEALAERIEALEKELSDLRVRPGRGRERPQADPQSGGRSEGDVLALGVARGIADPMGAAQAFLALARREPGLSGTARDYVERASEQGERIEGFLDRVLAYIGPPEAEFARADSEELFAPIERWMQSKARAEGIDFAVEAAGGPVCVHTDRELVGRILLHLLLQASEAVAEVPGACVRISVRAIDGALEWQIEDNGPGLVPELAARAFEPFADPRGTRAGLDLASARRLAECIGACVECEPSPRLGGVLFRLRLPQGEEFAGVTWA